MGRLARQVKRALSPCHIHIPVFSLEFFSTLTSFGRRSSSVSCDMLQKILNISLEPFPQIIVQIRLISH